MEEIVDKNIDGRNYDNFDNDHFSVFSSDVIIIITKTYEHHIITVIVLIISILKCIQCAIDDLFIVMIINTNITSATIIFPNTITSASTTSTSTTTTITSITTTIFPNTTNYY